MTPEPHWPWLMGPADKPDPRVGETSASASHRGTYGGHVWDHWLNQPAQPLREDNAA